MRLQGNVGSKFEDAHKNPHWGQIIPMQSMPLFNYNEKQSHPAFDAALWKKKPTIVHSVLLLASLLPIWKNTWESTQEKRSTATSAIIPLTMKAISDSTWKPIAEQRTSNVMSVRRDLHRSTTLKSTKSYTTETKSTKTNKQQTSNVIKCNVKIAM